jgi:hypothetical protein
VDLIAIRKDSALPAGDILKPGDLFDIILIQAPREARRQAIAVAFRR